MWSGSFFPYNSNWKLSDYCSNDQVKKEKKKESWGVGGVFLFFVQLPSSKTTNKPKKMTNTLLPASSRGNKTRVLTRLGVYRSKLVIAHLVHKAVKKDGRTFFVNTELTLGSVIISLFNVGTFLRAATNPHHPQEFVDIWWKKKKKKNVLNIDNLKRRCIMSTLNGSLGKKMSCLETSL